MFQLLLFLNYLKNRVPLGLEAGLQSLFTLLKGLLGIGLLAILAFFLFNFLNPLKIDIPYSTQIVDQKGELIHAFLSSDDKWRLKTELEEIIPELRKTLIFKEDRYFYQHPGVNPLAIARALFNNLLYLKHTSGASTITMQVARLLEPKERNYLNKLYEIFRALQIEYHLSKDEILQVYLNLLPYGGNVEGVKSAAQLFFQKKPHQLSLAEITCLTIIPNRPNSLVLGQDNALILHERNRWLRRFEKANLFPSATIQNARQETLQVQRGNMPRKAPHFVQELRKRYPKREKLSATLDSKMQAKVEQITANHVRRIQVHGIHNSAVLVVNNRTRAIEAYVGSQDFGDLVHSGQVDGIQAIRSPGSTLKPLAYALAMDQGLITPKSILEDIPANFGDYEPENFSRNFNGPVTVEEALIRSLNIPAVKILKKIGLFYFIDALKRAQFRQISRDEKKLGLSLVLGGCGASLENLVGLYSSFAHQGRYEKLRYLKEDSPKNNERLCSAEAAYCITEILSQATRPDLASSFENTYRIPKVAWKTGTSFGRIDAWSIAYNAHYTIGVWVGNFSGEGQEALVGAEMATPLLFEVFNSIDYNPSEDWFKAPLGLQVRWVCSESGQAPNTYCENQVMDNFIAQRSSTQLCNHLKEVWVDSEENHSYCLTCLPKEGKFQKKYYPNLSPGLIGFKEASGQDLARIPPHFPSCTRIQNDLEAAPEIISPLSEREYIINRASPPKMELRCQAGPEVEKVYWYLNEKFYRSASPREALFFKPELGFMNIACSDDQGRTRKIQIKVNYE